MSCRSLYLVFDIWYQKVHLEFTLFFIKEVESFACIKTFVGPVIAVYIWIFYLSAAFQLQSCSINQLLWSITSATYCAKPYPTLRISCSYLPYYGIPLYYVSSSIWKHIFPKNGSSELSFDLCACKYTQKRRAPR